MWKLAIVFIGTKVVLWPRCCSHVNKLWIRACGERPALFYDTCHCVPPPPSVEPTTVARDYVRRFRVKLRRYTENGPETVNKLGAPVLHGAQDKTITLLCHFFFAHIIIWKSKRKWKPTGKSHQNLNGQLMIVFFFFIYYLFTMSFSKEE